MITSYRFPKSVKYDWLAPKRRLAALEERMTVGVEITGTDFGQDSTVTLVATSMFEECSSLNLPESAQMSISPDGPFRPRVLLLPQAIAGKATNSPPVSLFGLGRMASQR